MWKQLFFSLGIQAFEAIVCCRRGDRKWNGKVGRHRWCLKYYWCNTLKMFWVEGSDEPVWTGQSVMDTGSLRFRWSRVEQLPYKAEMHLVRMCSMVHQWTWRIFADTCKSKYADVVFWSLCEWTRCACWWCGYLSVEHIPLLCWQHRVVFGLSPCFLGSTKQLFCIAGVQGWIVVHPAANSGLKVQLVLCICPCSLACVESRGRDWTQP